MSLALVDPEIRRRAAETRKKTCGTPEFREQMRKIAKLPRPGHSAEARKKMSAAKLGKKLTPEHRARISEASRRRWAADPDARKRQAEILRRNMTDPGMLAKWKLKQKPLTEKQRQDLSARAKKLWLDPERRARMSRSLTDPAIRRRAAETMRITARTPEFCKKMSEIASRPRRKHCQKVPAGATMSLSCCGHASA
jgi:hypothetical protein